MWPSLIPPGSSMEISGIWKEGQVKCPVALCRLMTLAMSCSVQSSVGLLDYTSSWIWFQNMLSPSAWTTPSPIQDRHQAAFLWLCQGQKVLTQALSEHGQAEGRCESTLLPTRQPQISKQHESQEDLIYSSCFNSSLSLVPRSHSRRGTEEFLPLSLIVSDASIDIYSHRSWRPKKTSEFTSQLHLAL